jgi:peptide/nickel transport system substrate-binding protein
MPVLNPWLPPPGNAKDRFVFERNPYYHRIDREGRQLPYVDRLVVDISAGSLVAAKANAGEVDFQARGLTMADAPVLREGEKANGYRTLLWPVARGSAYALYPNLNTEDPAWRALNRDARFRRALSLAIDRRILNNALLFGLGRESNNTVVPESPLHDPALRTLHARHDPDEANRLLDEVGLARRDSSGIRLLPDGRIAEIIVEVDGEAGDMIDALQLIAEFWRDVGVKLFVKPQERSILRNRSYSGRTVMVAAEGLDNAIPTAKMPPSELAPVRQDHYSWPKWGQFAETRGKSGEAPDTEDAKRLMALYKEWLSAGDDATKARAWREMLALHADRQWVIGTVNGQLQPVVITAQLRNVPEKALFSWEPTALIGVYRVDEFYLSE